MSPWDVALRLMAQPDRTTGHPDFIVAYLLAETERAGYIDPICLSQHPHDQMRRTWRNIRSAFEGLGRALRSIDFDTTGLNR